MSRGASRRAGGPEEASAPNGKTARAVAAALAQAYPAPGMPLRHRNAFQLLVATILSAQCTDAAVNRVTPGFFRLFPDACGLAAASTGAIESAIRTLGLYRVKARSLKRCAAQLVEEFGGRVPSTLEDLTRLAGVGRKTANVLLGHLFGAPAVIVDTHCARLARRLGLTREHEPRKIERDLEELLPPPLWTSFSQRLILHGRQVCRARKPACGRCVLLRLCPTGAREVTAAEADRRRRGS
ncbi:MAG TPA: endonuclease III [candidate division Zixibacteria bacterium]|nr:endonuclease III [candidate division Zixibacteria bacterium]